MASAPQITIGEFTIAFLTDGFWRNDGGCMFGVVPRELWKREHAPDELNRIRLNLTCPLIMKGREAVLVDTGMGNRLKAVEQRIFDHGKGRLPEALRALGLEAGDVTHVILSHLHFDHCGGIVRERASGSLEAAFPRARLFIRRGELAASRGARDERLRAAYRHVEGCLGPNLKRVEELGDDREVISGVEVALTGGHTHDHQIVLVRSGTDCLVHLADIVPTRSHIKGAWNQAYDLDPLGTAEKKAHYLQQAAERRWWVSFGHDDRVCAARVVNDRGRLVLGEKVAVRE